MQGHGRLPGHKMHASGLSGLDSATFRTFYHLFPYTYFAILQALPAWGIIKLISGYTPVTGAGVFLLFIVSQLLIAFKIFLKVVRFGSVTALMEHNLPKEAVVKENPVQTDPEYYDISTELKTETDVR